MTIKYKNKKIQKVCEDAYVAKKKYGARMAELIQQRIDELHSALNVEMMIQFNIGRCHPLHNNRRGQYALDLEHPYRLIFTVDDNVIQIVQVEEIIDYH